MPWEILFLLLTVAAVLINKKNDILLLSFFLHSQLGHSILGTVVSQMTRLGFFFQLPYATGGIRTNASRFAPTRDLLNDAQPTKLFSY